MLLEKDVRLHPSKLYSIEPRRIGTLLVESLTSYLKRLAKIHHLKVSDLINYCVAFASTEIPSQSYYLHSIDGINTSSSTQWVALIAYLTQRSDIKFLTMQFWDSIISSYQLLYPYQRWCSSCFTEMGEDNLYEPLIWRLNAVQICPIHNKTLSELCPNCEKSFTSMRASIVIGYCPHCGQSLSENADTEAHIETPSSLVALQKLFEYLPADFEPDKNMQSTLLKIAREILQVSDTELGRILGCSPRSIRLYSLNERILPLRTFLSLFNIVDIPSTQLTQNALVDYLGLVRRAERSTRSHEQTLHEQQKLLEGVISDGTIESMRNLAKRAGYTCNELKNNFPKLYTKSGKILRERKRKYCEIVFEEWITRIELALDSGCDIVDFPHIGLITVFEEAKVGKSYANKHFPELVQHLSRLIEKIHDQKQEYIRLYLDQIIELKPEPATSLRSIQLELSKSKELSLEKMFPKRAKVIIDRYVAYQKSQKAQICDLIQKTVHKLHEDGVYPSTEQIRRVVKDSWLIHGTVERDTYDKAMQDCGYNA